MRDEPNQFERDERPTVPSLYPHADPGEPDFGASRTWPVGAGRSPASRTAPRAVLPLVLAASLGVNVALLVGLAAVLVLARAGAFSPPGGSSGAPPAALGTATSATLSTPTPTTPLSNNSLQVAPNSVQLGCDGDQRTQYVVLTNSESQDVQWQAVFAMPTDQAGVELTPNQGTLHAGASIVLQIHSRDPSTTQQGVIRFTTSASAAPDAGMGAGPSLSYTAQGCG